MGASLGTGLGTPTPPSHRRAAAIDAGEFEAEIVPVALPDGTVMDGDEGVRRDSTPERMAALRPAFREGRMRREGIRYGLQTMCEGGGLANATILELP